MEWIGRARTRGHVLIMCSPTIDSSASQIESIHHPPNQAPRRSHRITPGAGRWTHSYLAWLRSMLIDFKVEDLAIFYHSSLQRLITGIRRRRGEEDNRERLPITKNFLLQLCHSLI